jgi:septal ring factor EnvC (AmiA/AmiB activator)
VEVSVYQVLLTICSLLLSGNIFFIKRLVDKIESTNEQRAKDQSSVSKLFQEVSSVSAQLREIKQEIKDLRRIEIDVAVLKSTRQSEINKDFT